MPAKRARSSKPARRAGGATKKFRSASVSRKKSGKRVSRGKRRSTKHAVGSSKARFAAKIASTLCGDRTVLYAFQDQITLTGTTANAVTQKMWSKLTGITTQLSVAILGSRMAGHVHDPQVLLECMQSGTPATAVSGGTTTTSAVKAAYTKMLVKSYKNSYKMTNAQTSPVEIWEYRVQARRDMTIDVDTVLSLAFTATVAQAVGSTTVLSALTVNPVSASTLGATPFMSNSFTRQYKIVKVKKRVIMPGKWWIISYSSIKPKIFSYKDLSDGDDNSATLASRIMLRGQRVSLFVASGTAASTAHTGGGTLVGLSNVNLLIDQRVKIHYAMFGDSATTSTGGVFLAGFSAADGPQIPLPQVQNQPLYSIGTVTTANGTVQPMVTSATAAIAITGGVDGAQANPLAGPFV